MICDLDWVCTYLVTGPGTAQAPRAPKTWQPPSQARGPRFRAYYSIPLLVTREMTLQLALHVNNFSNSLEI